MQAYMQQNYGGVNHDLEKSDVYSLGVMFMLLLGPEMDI